MQGTIVTDLADLELHEHAWRVIGSNVGAHGKDPRLIEGGPQLAPLPCITHAASEHTAGS